MEVRSLGERGDTMRAFIAFVASPILAFAMLGCRQNTVKVNLPANDTRGAIQHDYQNGRLSILNRYTKEKAAILRAYQAGTMGEGTAKRRLDTLEDSCSRHLDALENECQARMERFDD